MSKRRQTTGVPKPIQAKRVTKQKEEPKGALQRLLKTDYEHKHEREAAVQRLVILGVGLALGIAAIVFLIAFAVATLITPNQAVASVNGTAISVSQFESRVRLERAMLNNQLNQAVSLYRQFGATDDQINQQLFSQPPYSTWLNEMQVPDQLGNRVINDMVEDELVRQQAAERGITVTSEEVDAEIRDFFGYDPNAGLFTETPTLTPTFTRTPFVSPTPSPVPTSTPTTPPTVTPESTADLTPTVTPFPSATPTSTPNATERADQFNTQREDYFNYLRTSARLDDAAIRRYFETQLLRKKLGEALTEGRTTGLWVSARHILVATIEEAQQVLDALNAGESFAGLASELSTDTSSAARGGELDWTQISGFVTEFADAARTAEIGAFVGPVQTEFGYHIIQVRAREERELDATQLEDEQNREVTRYIDDLRDAPETSVEIYDTWTNHVPTSPPLLLTGATQ
jgi:parvulin-like peptidyl-prolyl isomerase